MKERCAYMQEVNSLCKDVEQATMPTQRKTSEQREQVEESEPTPDSPSKTSTSEAANKTKLTASVSSPELSRQEKSRTASPSELNPVLADLATEVKDLNVRFASTCMQAKQHYASLSKVLTASIERHTSLRSSMTSIRSSKSLNGHYVKITQISERHDGKGQDLVDSGSSQSSNASAFETTDTDTAKTKSMLNGGSRHGHQTSHRNEINPALTPSPSDSKNPSATNSQNMTPKLDRSAARKQGVAQTSAASMLTTTGSPPKLMRSSSVSTSTDIDSEIHKKLQKKYPVVLRSKSVSSEGYTDTQPRPRRRPKSAVIIEANADGETALVSEVELRTRSNNRAKQLHRRSSMEINLSSLTDSNLLVHSNLLQANSPSTPVGFLTRTTNPNTQTQAQAKAFGSVANLKAGDRSSVVSIESLDPRAMITGQLQQNSHVFNSSIGPDVLKLDEVQGFADSPELSRARQRNGNLNVPENRLQSAQRSVSMDTLALSKKKGSL